MKKFLFLVLAFAVAGPLLAGTKTVTLEVKGWTCGGCAASTRIALTRLDGVENVLTDHERMEAIVTYDDSKIAPEKLRQAIEKLGYKATVKAAATASTSSSSTGASTLGASTSPERVSFFEVPLGCCAAEDLGCGSLAKPILKELGADSRVAEARINESGSMLAVAWKDPAQSGPGSAAVRTAFEKRALTAKSLAGPARDEALEGYGLVYWYDAGEVDRLSDREAGIIAVRLVRRAGARLELAPDRATALTRDLAVAIARHLTLALDEDCAEEREAFDRDLTKVAGKHLSPPQLAELRKAAKQGFRALPGETPDPKSQ